MVTAVTTNDNGSIDGDSPSLHSDASADPMPPEVQGATAPIHAESNNAASSSTSPPSSYPPISDPNTIALLRFFDEKSDGIMSAIQSLEQHVRKMDETLASLQLPSTSRFVEDSGPNILHNGISASPFSRQNNVSSIAANDTRTFASRSIGSSSHASKISKQNPRFSLSKKGIDRDRSIPYCRISNRANETNDISGSVISVDEVVSNSSDTDIPSTDQHSNTHFDRSARKPHQQSYFPPNRQIETNFGDQKEFIGRRASWEERFEELKAYKDLHGTCDVPQSNKTGLGVWISAQRSQYKRFLVGKSSSMSAARKEALEGIGITWSLRKRATWDERYAELKAHSEVLGSCDVPNDKGHKQLWAWCQNQRQAYKRGLEGKPAALLPERVELMEKIGFRWLQKSNCNRLLDQVTMSSEGAEKSTYALAYPTSSSQLENHMLASPQESRKSE